MLAVRTDLQRYAHTNTHVHMLHCRFMPKPRMIVLFGGPTRSADLYVFLGR